MHNTAHSHVQQGLRQPLAYIVVSVFPEQKRGKQAMLPRPLHTPMRTFRSAGRHSPLLIGYSLDSKVHFFDVMQGEMRQVHWHTGITRYI